MFSGLLRGLGIEGTPHGMRSSFRDWCSETGVAREVAEAALAHVVKNKVEAAYARSDMLDREARGRGGLGRRISSGKRRDRGGPNRSAEALAHDRLPVMSQLTLWGHASRVPGRGWRGAVPPLTPPTATAHHGRWTRVAPPLPPRRRVLMADSRTTAARVIRDRARRLASQDRGRQRGCRRCCGRPWCPRGRGPPRAAAAQRARTRVIIDLECNITYVTCMAKGSSGRVVIVVRARTETGALCGTHPSRPDAEGMVHRPSNTLSQDESPAVTFCHRGHQ